MQAGELANLVSDDSHVRFEPYFSRQEGDWYLAGWSAKDVYLQLPKLGIRAMELLQEGLSVREAQERLIVEEGTAANVLGFVQNMARRGLVASVDEQPAREADASPPPGDGRSIPLLPDFDARYVRWLFSVPMLALYGLLALTSGLVLAARPEFVPTSADWFFVPFYGVNILLVYLTNIALIFVHEIGHCTAARAFGIEGRLGLSRRLYEPVAVTKLGSIWRVPKRHRSIINLAGIMVNVCLFSIALLLVVLTPGWLPGLVHSWLQAAMVSLWVSTGWQFSLYMRTDIYYLVADLLGARNLMDDARAFIRHSLARLVPRVRPPAHGWTLRGKEARTVRAYAVVYVLGIGVASYFFLFFNLPFLFRTVTGAIGVLLAGSTSSFRFIDSLLVLLVLGTHYGILVVVWLREGKLSRLLTIVRRALPAPAR